MRTPECPGPELIPSLLAASDVLGTGWFGAVAADAGPGRTVAVVGDPEGALALADLVSALIDRPSAEELPGRPSACAVRPGHP